MLVTLTKVFYTYVPGYYQSELYNLIIFNPVCSWNEMPLGYWTFISFVQQQDVYLTSNHMNRILRQYTTTL